jgi:hypothetical protein
MREVADQRWRGGVVCGASDAMRAADDEIEQMNGRFGRRPARDSGERGL